MSSKKPLLVVLGATGNQGGSVITYLLSLSASPYALRGVTRDPTSSKAKSLSSEGVEMVYGDFDDPASLDAAFKGASAIFTVTDFWLGFASASVREKAAASGQSVMITSRENETQQNKNIIDAAAKVDTLERFVYSGLPNTNKLSGGKYDVYHFDGKGIAEEYGSQAHPKLWKKTSVLYAGFYLENYQRPVGAMMRPQLNKSKDTLVLSIADPVASTPLPMYSAIADTGGLVYALLNNPPGKKLSGVNEWLSMREFAKVLAGVLGKNIEFVDHTPSYDFGDPELEKDHMDMMGFCVEFKYDGSAVDKSIIQPADLEERVQLASVKEWCEKQDWSIILQAE